MTRRVIVEAEASAELRNAALWYEEQGSSVGSELVAVVEVVFAALAANTAASVTVPGIANSLGVRRVLLGRFPYAIVHLETLEAIHVLAVAHLKRRPNYWRTRLRRVTGPGSQPAR